MNTASASATAGFEIGGEGQPPGLDVVGDQFIEAGLEDRHLAALRAPSILPRPCRRK